MKIVDLLLISFIVLLFSCKNNSKNVSQEIVEKNKTIKDTTVKIIKSKVNNNIVKDSIKVDSIKKKKIIKKNPKLKVIINGKVYYKKNSADKQKGSKNSYIFYDVIKKLHYDIRTGEYEIIPKGEPSEDKPNY